MDIPSASDYVSVKKRKAMDVCNFPPNSGAYIANKQYLTLQTTAISDDEGKLVRSERFMVQLPSRDLATYTYWPKCVYPMFSLRRW